MFATAWPSFHNFSRSPSLMTFFNLFTRQWLDSQFSPRLYRATMNLFKHNIRTSFITACCNIVFMPASYVVELYDRVLQYWVLCPRAMSSSFTTACCNIEFYARQLLASFMTACLDVEPAGHVLKWFDLKIKKSHIKMNDWFVDRVPGCWTNWSRARVCWPRAQ